jgi:glutaminyl-tRNA synthetase
VKGNIHWVSVKHAFAAGVRSYDRLFKNDHPEGVEDLNPASKAMSMAQLEPSLENPAESSFQFERHGYFAVDAKTARVFNRTVTLRDSWTKG